jgi:hypothetical protein
MYTATLAIDQIVPTTTVSLQSEMTVRQFIETAFVQLQTKSNPDPFRLTIDYFGYDYYQGDTSYLGYFIVSIDQGTQVYASGSSNYWELFVSGQPCDLGIDSRLVQPGDQVELRWLPCAAPADEMSTRTRRVQQRRVNRVQSASGDMPPSGTQ